MKFVRVSKIAEQLNMDVAVVFEMVQKKLFEKGLFWYWEDYNIAKYNESHFHCHTTKSGLVIIIENKKLSYASEDFCNEEYDSFYYLNLLKIEVKDFDIIYNNTVELSGEYTKEQLQEILNNMEE